MNEEALSINSNVATFSPINRTRTALKKAVSLEAGLGESDASAFSFLSSTSSTVDLQLQTRRAAATRRRSTTMNFGKSPLPNMSAETLSGVGGVLMAKRSAAKLTLHPRSMILTLPNGSKQLASFDFVHRLNPRTHLATRSASTTGWDSWNLAMSFSAQQRAQSVSLDESSSFQPSQELSSDVPAPTSFRPPPPPDTSATDLYSLANNATKKYISPIIARRDNSKTLAKREVESVFTRLRHEHIHYHSDVPTEAELAQKDRYRCKKGERTVKSVFSPMCRVLEELWAHYHVGREEQRAFSEKYFFPATHENYLIVSREVVAYTNRGVSVGHDLVRLVNLREIFLGALATVVANSGLVDAITPLEHEGLVARVFNLILALRDVTCRVVDALYQKRDSEGKAAPLMWEGKNYVSKMQDDLGFLAGSYLTILVPNLRVRANPMLLPAKYFPDIVIRQPKAMTSTKKKSTAPPSPMEDSSFVNSSLNPQNPLNTSTTSRSTAKSAASPAVTPTKRETHTAPHRPRGSGSEPALVQQPDLLPASCMPQEKEPPLVILRDGEVTEMRTDLTQRQQYFSRVLRDEYRAAHKISKEHCNVFQYPPSVYLPKPRPLYEMSGARLERSLDPEIRSACFNENESQHENAFAVLRLPPKFSQEKENTIVDLATGCYRPASTTRLYTFSELHQRELLLFAENAIQRKEGMRAKRRRGLFKMRAAYRGFISTLHRHRQMNDSHCSPQHGGRSLPEGASSAKGKDFEEWVRVHAPQWLPELNELLKEPEDDFFSEIMDDSFCGVSTLS